MKLKNGVNKSVFWNFMAWKINTIFSSEMNELGKMSCKVAKVIFQSIFVIYVYVIKNKISTKICLEVSSFYLFKIIYEMMKSTSTSQNFEVWYKA